MPESYPVIDAGLNVRVGDPAGACSDSIKALKKVTVGNLYDTTHPSTLPEAIHSPAHDTLHLFRISEHQLSDLFHDWLMAASPREAVCQWVAENMDYIYSNIPRSYPRVLEYEDFGALMYICVSLGGISVLLVLTTAALVYTRRDTRAIKQSQIDYLFTLLAGSFMISLGAILYGAPPSDTRCVVAVWLINFGYTFELVPLVVKLGAISRLMAAGRRMRRVQIQPKGLIYAVATIWLTIVVFLGCWTIFDPPRREIEYGDIEETTSGLYTVVRYNYFCSSNSVGWYFADVAWKVFVLLCAAVVAFQLRYLQEALGESRTLAFLVYSQFVFVILRLSVLFLSDAIGWRKVAQLSSVLFSVDTIATMAIYFIPKLFEDGANASENQSSRLFRSQSLQDFDLTPGNVRLPESPSGRNNAKGATMDGPAPGVAGA